ncbi:MAG: LAGLIDADG family homing endonuclease [Elusimicrobiota bacterium]
MAETDKAYLAGLIDGEGTITLTRHHRNQFPQPRVSISNNSLELLEWVRERLGCGNIIRRSPRKEHHGKSYVWQVQLAGSALKVLREIRPYLVLKRRHADLLLEDYKACTPRNGKYSPSMLAAKRGLVGQIRRLNQTGRSRFP